MRLACSAALLFAHDDGWFHHMDGWGGGWMWLSGTLMMLTWVVIIAAAVFLVARSLRSEQQRPDRAKEILDERYAQGEITSEEYQKRIEHLRRTPSRSR